MLSARRLASDRLGGAADGLSPPVTPDRRAGTRRLHMGLLRRLGILGVATLVLGAATAGDAQSPRKGGVLRIGILGEPPTLDAHWSTTAIVEILTNHVYEGLYTLDQDNR